MADSDSRSDLDLIAAINRGDDQAFAVLYYRHRDWAYRLAWRFTRHEEDARDVLQETFAYFARRFPGFTLTAQLTTYLYPIIKNTAIAVQRRKRREANLDVAARSEASEEAPSASDDLAVLLAGLSPDHREIVLMRCVDDMTLEEIATALAIPLGTAKSRLHHAMGALRDNQRIRSFFEKS